MLPSIPINDIQSDIIKRLRRVSGMRFAALNVDNVSSDQFSYHLRHLQRTGLVEKDEQGLYKLSVTGKSQSLLIAPDAAGFIRQGFIAVRVVYTKSENGQQFFLLQKRAEVPYQGRLTEPGGKIVAGSTVDEAARYHMRYQTGLDCNVELKGLVHFLDEYQGQIVQDKYFFVLHATRLAGELRTDGPLGENLWMTYEEIKASPLSLPGLLTTLELGVGERFAFHESKFVADEY